MLFAAKLAAPLPLPFRGQPSCLTQAVESPVSLFVAPPDYLHTGVLAAILIEHQRPGVWIRLGPEDQDPAQLLLTLLASLSQVNAAAGASVLEHMRCRPGPIFGWPPLFQSARQEMLAVLPPATAAIVLEGLHYLCGPTPVLTLLMRDLICESASALNWILIAHQTLPRFGGSPPIVHYGVEALRLTEQAAVQMNEDFQSPLATQTVRHIARLTNGSIGALYATAQSADELGPATVEQTVREARDGADLMTRLAHAWCVTLAPEAVESLLLGMRLQYTHPTLLQSALGHSSTPSGPWWQPLSGEWQHLGECWRAPLRAAMRNMQPLRAEVSQRTAYCLREHNAVAWAIRLLLDSGAEAAAAEMMGEAVSALLDLGQWTTLDEWLRRLSPVTLSSYPHLAFARGELAAAHGELGLARRSFSIAGNLYAHSGNSEGACLSWLAESTLAMWQGDYVTATTCARQSARVAQNAALSQINSWAQWQLGCLAVAADQINAAMENFACATALCDAGDDLATTEEVRRVEALARYWHEVREQREYHQQAYALAERAEIRAAERLRTSIGSSHERWEAVLNRAGWSRTPLMAKLAGPVTLSSSPKLAAPIAFGQIWQAILGWFHQRPAQATPTVPVVISPMALEPPADWPALTSERETETVWTTSVETVTLEPAPVEVVTATPTPPPLPRERLTLRVQMLGPIRLAINDRSVEHWPKGKALALLKYLLLQRHQPVVRDVLMDVFWPDAEPESARNRLNVTLHALRQNLRAVTDLPVVVFEAGAYSLNPKFTLQTDVEAFEQHIQAGHRWEADKKLLKAAAEYENALRLYAGDLLADDLYESWPVLAREKLRAAFLDTLDRLSQIHFAGERYEQCVVQCLRLLQHDNCREDAHCRLMRSYSRMGQPHQALRQYEACLGALRAELDTDPSPATTQLYHRIRQHELV